MRVSGFGFLLAGLALGAVGCGTQVASGGGAGDALAAAVSQTSAQTARVAITTSTREQDMTLSFTATGVFDFAHSLGRLSMRSPADITEIFLPPNAYIKVSGAGVGTGLPKGKSWLDVSDASSGMDAAADPLGMFGGTSTPAGLLASLTAISGAERKLGTTTIRGVPVTEYQVDVDPAKAADRLPGGERASFRQFAKMLGSGTIPVHVWVDGKNLVRRVQMTLKPLTAAAGISAGLAPSSLPTGLPTDLPTGLPSGFPTNLPSSLPSGLMPAGPGSSGGNVQISVSADYYDFGVPVRVSAPPAAQVASMSDFLGGGLMPGGSVTYGGSAVTPPKASGTLTSAQESAAGQAAAAFWAALGTNDPARIGQAVLPGQQACVQSNFSAGSPAITVSSFRVVSVRPAGPGGATVRYRVAAKVSMAGHVLAGLIPRRVQWLSAAERAGHWYVNLNSGSLFTGSCS